MSAGCCPLQALVPACLKGSILSLAVRISAHPLVRALCAQTGPLVSTSANPATLEPASSQQEVEQYFKTGLDGILAVSWAAKRSPRSFAPWMVSSYAKPITNSIYLFDPDEGVKVLP